MVVDLNNLKGLPQEFLTKLSKHDMMFSKFSSIEKFEDYKSIHQLITNIDAWCLNNKVIGYHYTNAIEDDFKKNGILIRPGHEIRNEFIKRNFHLFSSNEQDLIISKWEKVFDKEEEDLRDNIIHFNFTKNALKEGLAVDLLTYYGGEQINSALREFPGIRKKLTKIGIPLILKCTLDPNNIKTFHEYPWGRIAVSSYHKKINPDAFREDEDGYQAVAVSPENIEIIRLKRQKNKFRLL
ncbi:MAG: hypothetical protein K0B37_15770 [Bacteroidales bacterium]|nr:hypothetical protein [Bacteroidales bacterium]